MLPEDGSQPGTLPLRHHVAGSRSRSPPGDSLYVSVANLETWHENGGVLQPGQPVRVNLAGLRVKNVTFQAAVTDAVGHIVRQTSEDPPVYLVRLLFSFRGVDEVEVPAERIKTAT
jgi:hypothetical protein